MMRVTQTISEQSQNQLPIDLEEHLADIARHDPEETLHEPLPTILRERGASLRCQYDAFADYVAEAEKHGPEKYPLHAWTKATIDNPAKKAKYLRSFTLHVDGEEVYAKEKADALEQHLQPLVGGLVTRLARHDTNPANNPQPPARYRQ
jgi:hypothetical protein